MLLHKSNRNAEFRVGIVKATLPGPLQLPFINIVHSYYLYFAITSKCFILENGATRCGCRDFIAESS